MIIAMFVRNNNRMLGDIDGVSAGKTVGVLVGVFVGTSVGLIVGVRVGGIDGIKLVFILGSKKGVRDCIALASLDLVLGPKLKLDISCSLTLFVKE
eukprot:7997055-Ditylum_brightwellii.AAC.1